MFEAVRDGEIKAIWIACTNPAQSLPDQRLVHEALERAELVVVQDAYRNTETAAYADVFLPAAGWGEKDGTMTNSERRISRVRAVVPPPGEARADWRIVVDFAQKARWRAAYFRIRSPKRSSTSIGKPRAGATWTSLACRMRSWTSGVRSSGRFRPGRCPAENGFMRMEGSRRRPVGRASCRHRSRPWLRTPMMNIRCG